MIIFTLNSTHTVRGSKNALHCAKKRSPSFYFLDSLVWLEIKTRSAIVNRQKHESSVLKNTLNLLPHEDILNTGTLGGTIWLPEFSSIKVVKFIGCFFGGGRWGDKGNIVLLILHIQMNTINSFFFVLKCS